MQYWWIFLWLGYSSVLHAQYLHFEHPVQVVKVPEGAKQMAVDYAFTNTSGHAVRVKKIDAPCDCLDAQVFDAQGLAEKPVFQAGESGLVRATLELGSFKGKIRKKILLWLDSDKDASPSVFLTMDVKVPYLIAAYPRALQWKKGADTTSQQFDIRVTHTEPIHILQVKPSSPNFEATLETVKEGFHYRLRVTPKSTSKNAFGTIQLTTDSKDRRFKRVQCFVSIK